MGKHPKNVGEYTDMKKLAEDIGNLHYETLYELLGKLAHKLGDDCLNDQGNGRQKLANELAEASNNITDAACSIGTAWEIFKPFMKDDEII